MVHDLRFLRHPGEFRRSNRLYRRYLYLSGLRRANAILTNSGFTRAEVLQEVPGLANEPHVAHLGADHVDLWMQPTATAHPHAIAFAHWSNKRPDMAVRAWALLHRRVEDFNTVLHVVGCRGSSQEELSNLAQDLAISSLVQVHGFLDEQTYSRLFATSVLVVLPSSMEGFGLPVVEAERLGIPVVTTAAGAVREVGGTAPLYCSEPGVSAFAEACEQGLYDESWRQAAIADGRSHASRYTWARTAEITRGVLDEAVRRARHDLVRQEGTVSDSGPAVP